MLMCLASIAAIAYTVPTPYTPADELVQEEMTIPGSEEKIIDAYAADRVKYDAAHAAQASLDAEEQTEPAEATEVDDEDDKVGDKSRPMTKPALQQAREKTDKKAAHMKAVHMMKKAAMKPNATKKEEWGDEDEEFEEVADDEDEDEDGDEEELAEEDEEFKPKNATMIKKKIKAAHKVMEKGIKKKIKAAHMKAVHMMKKAAMKPNATKKEEWG